MNGFLLALLLGICAGTMMGQRERPGWVYEFPFLAAATFGGFIVPQAYGLVKEGSIAEGAMARGLWMCILCAAAGYAGYMAVPPKRPPGSELKESRIVATSAVFTGVGAVFFYWISRLPAETTESSQWTGAPVALLFFAKALSCGLALATLEWARTGSAGSLVVAVCGVCLYADRILVAGRRQAAAELVFITALGLWFGRRWVPRRWVAMGTAGVATLLVYSTAEFRSARLDGGSGLGAAVAGLPLVENFERVLREGGPEFRNALSGMERIAEGRAYDFGLFNWNKLIMDFVPAQVVGREVKGRLLNAEAARANEQLTSEAPVGSTLTGMTDAFSSFGYGGFVKFLVIGGLMGWVYRRAASGRIPEQVAYMLFVVPSLHAITHSTQFFFSSMLHTLLFLLPAWYWLRGFSPAKSGAIGGEGGAIGRGGLRRSEAVPAHPGPPAKRGGIVGGASSRVAREKNPSTAEVGGFIEH